MKALVVYESMWGNTEQIARAIADGLAEASDVEIVDVRSAPKEPGPDVALIVAGGPTHAFSMTRAATRTDAVSQGAPQGSVETGLREWLDSLTSGRHAQQLATFDTRVSKARRLPGSAAKSASKVAHRHGFATPAPPETFWVLDTKGPLLRGELNRATGWGRTLASSISSPA